MKFQLSQTNKVVVVEELELPSEFLSVERQPRRYRIRLNCTICRLLNAANQTNGFAQIFRPHRLIRILQQTSQLKIAEILLNDDAQIRIDTVNRRHGQTGFAKKL